MVVIHQLLIFDKTIYIYIINRFTHLGTGIAIYICRKEKKLEFLTNQYNNRKPAGARMEFPPILCPSALAGFSFQNSEV